MAVSEEDIYHMVENVPAFVPHLTKDRAKEMLRDDVDGSYLLRFSVNTGSLVLTVSIRGRCKHYVMDETADGTYTFDGDIAAETVIELLKEVCEVGFEDAEGKQVLPSRPCSKAVEAHLAKQVDLLFPVQATSLIRLF